MRSLLLVTSLVEEGKQRKTCCVCCRCVCSRVLDYIVLAGLEGERERVRGGGREWEGARDRQTDRQSKREREAGRQAGRQTNRQIDVPSPEMYRSLAPTTPLLPPPPLHILTLLH